ALEGRRLAPPYTYLGAHERAPAHARCWSPGDFDEGLLRAAEQPIRVRPNERHAARPSEGLVDHAEPLVSRDHRRRVPPRNDEPVRRHDPARAMGPDPRGRVAAP